MEKREAERDAAKVKLLTKLVGVGQLRAIPEQKAAWLERRLRSMTSDECKTKADALVYGESGK